MKSVAENTTEEMSEWIISHAAKAVSRELEELEKALIEFAVVQMKYEFWR